MTMLQRLKYKSNSINSIVNSLRYLFTETVPDIDLSYYCDHSNINEIKNNISSRKGSGNIELVLDLHNKIKSMSSKEDSYKVNKSRFLDELLMLPNKTHPKVTEYLGEPVVIKNINNKKEFNGSPLECSDIVRRLNLMRTEQLGHTCGPKSYYFFGELAELEEALIKYTVRTLIKENFQLVSVPDVLPSKIITSCGMNVNTDRTQIYFLDPLHHGPELCLSGTAEMSLAGLLMNSVHDINKLPLKLAAVSRCFRAETSNVIEERGIYRVHQFTKVEMFIVSTPEQSDEMLEYVRTMQESLFTPLDVCMQVLDMPPHELGAPAFRKYDIEAWMPGRGMFGEISSCSNCTDYQSRRLHIKYEDAGTTNFVHTLNGTACAVPRMLIALIETHQQSKGKISIPKVLQPFMNGKEYISKNSLVPELKLTKIKK